jgi:hypothetical protein
MGDRKPIGVAYRDQDIDGGDIGTGFADLALVKPQRRWWLVV